MIKVLVACEESQRICTEFRNRDGNFEAYSCDVVSCSGGHPEWHIKQDVLPLLKGNCEFKTVDGKEHKVDKWDLIIAHPPCTYLTVSGNRWFNVDRYGELAIERLKEREDAIKFFMAFVDANCECIAIENPIGVMSRNYRKADQIIQPWMFGDNVAKSTCLWLKGLPKLEAVVKEKPELEYKEWVSKKGIRKRQSLWYFEALTKAKTAEERRELRSKTFIGVAKAIAKQWGDFLIKQLEVAE